MHRRPAALSILGGWLSFSSIIIFFIYLHSVFMSEAPFYTRTDQGKVDLTSLAPIVWLVASLLSFICAINILEGLNWARWLYAAVCVGLLSYELIAFIDFPFALWAGMACRGVMLLVLFLPGANDFFKQPI